MTKSTVHVYSYRRFSSGRQAKGHSLERQTAAAVAWCQEHGYELDEDLALADLGVSAYSGDNASRGALSGFLTAIERGLVPGGSILLVESLDRLSRAAIPEAVGLLTSIVRGGVRVVSLLDGLEWNDKSIEDFQSFLLSVVLFSRAHNESSTKAKRVREAFQKKRKAELPVVSSAHGPGWARPKTDHSGWLVVKPEAESVVRTFKAAASGLGGVAIARIANTEGWVLPWRKRANTNTRWEHTGVSRLLRDRRVLGEWQPKRLLSGNLVLDGEPVLSYFPQIISDELWTQVEVALGLRSGPKRLRGINADIFAGLVYCECGERMERKAPATRGYARYYCQGRKAGLCLCPGLPERILTGPVLSMLAQGEQAAFNPETLANEARERLVQAQVRIKDHEQRAERIMESIEQGGHSAMLSERLLKIERGRASALEDADTAKRELDKIPLKNQKFGDEMAAMAAQIVADKTKFKERQKLAGNIAQIVKRIVWSGPGSFILMDLRSGVQFGVNSHLSTYAKAEDARTRRRREAAITTK